MPKSRQSMMRSSIRLAVSLFVCFAASTSYPNNPIASEHDRVIPSQFVDPSDQPSSNNSFLKRLKRADFCGELKDQPVPEVLSKCTELWSSADSSYVLRIGQDVKEETWKPFAEKLKMLMVDVEISGSTLTELKLTLDGLNNQKFIISNNPSLQSITITSGYNGILSENLEIKGNPALSSIKIKSGSIDGNLAISENGKLATLEFETGTIGPPQSFGKFRGFSERNWIISKNPLLNGIQLKKTIKSIIINGKLQIVENKALSKLDLAESAQFFIVNGIEISKNDALEAVKIPEITKIFCVDKLEISQNTKLTAIDLGNKAKWQKSAVNVQDNPALPPDLLKTLKTFGESRKTRDAGSEVIWKYKCELKRPPAWLEALRTAKTKSIEEVEGITKGPEKKSGGQTSQMAFLSLLLIVGYSFD